MWMKGADLSQEWSTSDEEDETGGAPIHSGKYDIGLLNTLTAVGT